jgi:hypothetical protein
VLADGWRTDLERFRKNPEAAKKLLKLGESPANAHLDSAEVAAWTLAANVLLNLDEAVTRE